MNPWVGSVRGHSEDLRGLARSRGEVSLGLAAAQLDLVVLSVEFCSRRELGKFYNDAKKNQKTKQNKTINSDQEEQGSFMLYLMFAKYCRYCARLFNNIKILCRK